MRIYSCILVGFLAFFAKGFAQTSDSTWVMAHMSEDLKSVQVRQRIILQPGSPAFIQDEIKLLNYAAAFQSSGTPLADRLLEDRNKELHFAKAKDLAKIADLKMTLNGAEISGSADSQVISFPNLGQNQRHELHLSYTLHLPRKDIIGLGSDGKEAMVQYFFILPAVQKEHFSSPEYFQNTQEQRYPGLHWEVQWQVPKNYQVYSGLQKDADGKFTGAPVSEPQFLISPSEYRVLGNNDSGTAVVIAQPLTQNTWDYLEFYVPLHLGFLREKLPPPKSGILITPETFKANNFDGIDDVGFWKLKFQLFTDAQKTDLHYFSVIASQYIKEVFITDFQKNHWLYHGLKTWLEMEYLAKHYPDEKLLGQLPEKASFLRVKPLKIFHAAHVPLMSRYGLAYQYILRQNLDQPIGTAYRDLSRFNQQAISAFETGTLFRFLSQEMGQAEFTAFLHEFFRTHEGKDISETEFLASLALASEGRSQFLNNYLKSKQRVNVRLHKIIKEHSDGATGITVSKNINEPLPVKIETFKNGASLEQKWELMPEGEQKLDITMEKPGFEKVTINHDYLFPEKTFHDNYLYSKSLFANIRKIRLKPLTDLPNPEYLEIFLNPRLSFNAYDKVLLGLNIRNKSLLTEPYTYSFTPYYSTGTGKLAGTGALSYQYMPPDSFFRTMSAGVSVSNFHYNYGLSYTRVGAALGLNFTKNPRSVENRSMGVSYNYLLRELTEEMRLRNDYDQYHLFGVSYHYQNPGTVKEEFFSVGGIGMQDFVRFSAEYFQRWEFAKSRKLSTRIFAGAFLFNNTRNSTFDFGISRVSDFAFSYGLFGTSATTGFLSQQYILAETGMKSRFRGTVNGWVLSTNVEYPIWKMFHLYADAAVYKNKAAKTQFIYDSGVKISIVPDFVEVFFPIQSSLGFEPGFKDYTGRIRYTLVLNLGSIISYARRGLF